MPNYVCWHDLGAIALHHLLLKRRTVVRNWSHAYIPLRLLIRRHVDESEYTGVNVSHSTKVDVPWWSKAQRACARYMRCWRELARFVRRRAGRFRLRVIYTRPVRNGVRYRESSRGVCVFNDCCTSWWRGPKRYWSIGSWSARYTALVNILYATIMDGTERFVFSGILFLSIYANQPNHERNKLHEDCRKNWCVCLTYTLSHSCRILPSFCLGIREKQIFWQLIPDVNVLRGLHHTSDMYTKSLSAYLW